MIDFLRDAPTGALILFLGGIATMLAEIPFGLRLKAQMERHSEGTLSEPPSRSLLRWLVLLTPLSWALVIGGLAWYVFAD